MESLITSSEISSVVTDFSLLSLFLRADLVVKTVIIILILSSIWSWTIIASKIVTHKRLKQLENEFDEIFWSGNTFDDLYETFNQKGRSQMNLSYINSLKERMNRSMLVTFNKESELIEKNLTFLATAGSTAPFVGLFGTVWGIMNSFQSIAIAQNTNLAVVAPGIAEALFATALGLFVAIPAVVAYNKISSDLSKYFMSLESFIDQFSTIFFRQLESN